MGQFVGCIEGIAEACRALDFPVVSGNVSLYNETKGEDGTSLAILPTPAIGGVGLLDDWERSATIAFKAEGHHIWIIGGKRGTHMCQSLWLRELYGCKAGPPPPVDLNGELTAAALIHEALERDWITAVHDCSDGGILVAIAEMALAGNIGAQVEIDWTGDTPISSQMFGEDQGRYIVTVADGDDHRLIDRAVELGVPLVWGGVTGDNYINIGDGPHYQHFGTATLADLRAAHEGFFPKLMGSELTPEF
jgi:phosphoribosylformylglycinamidine (FGAM) synthase-like enzyme